MATGTVKFFNTPEGLRIHPADRRLEGRVRAHQRGRERAGMRTLMEGQKVNFEVITERGKQAAGNLSLA